MSIKKYVLKTETIKPNQGYIRIKLLEMNLKHEGGFRELFKQGQFPIFTSDIKRPPLRWANEQHLVQVIGPTGENDKYRFKDKNLLIENLELLPLTPYNGGTIGIKFNFIALPVKFDSSAMLFDTMREMSKYLHPTIELATSITAKLTQIARQMDRVGELLAQLQSEIGGGDIDGGVFLVANVTSDDLLERLKTSELGYEEQDNELLIDDDTEELNCDYFIYSIEGSNKRRDWESLPSIKTFAFALAEAVAERDTDKLETALFDIRRAILVEPEIATRDANRIVRAIEKKAREDVKTGNTKLSSTELSSWLTNLRDRTDLEDFEPGDTA